MPSPTSGAKSNVGGDRQKHQQPAAQQRSANDSYKEYVYSPVSTRPLSSSVYLPTTLPKDEEVDRIGKSNKFRFEMEESGSQTLQYIAATAGMLNFLVFFFFEGKVGKCFFFKFE